MLQSLPSIKAQRGAEKGGIILGLVKLKETAIDLLESLGVNGADQEAIS